MNNEEKILAMLEQMNTRFDQVDGRLDKVDARLDKVDARLDDLQDQVGFVRGTVAKIENEHGKLLGALHDGYKLSWERHQTLVPRVSRLENIAEQQDMEIEYLKSVR